MSFAKEKQALTAARQLAKIKSGWELYQALLGPFGEIRLIFRSEPEMDEFKKTAEFQKILDLIIIDGRISAVAQQALIEAQDLAKKQQADDLFKAVFGEKGLIDRLFPDDNDRKEFQRTLEYKQILALFSKEHMNSAKVYRILLNAKMKADHAAGLQLHDQLFDAKDGTCSLIESKEEKNEFEKSPEYQEVLNLSKKWRFCLRWVGWLGYLWSFVSAFWSFIWGTSEASPEEEWGAVELQLAHRHECLQETMKKLEDYGITEEERKLTCAVVDVFVEKAQYKLTRRGQMMVKYGNLCAFFAGSTLVVGIIFVVSVLMKSEWLTWIGPHPEAVKDPYDLTVLVVRTITLGGLVAGLVYLFFSLSKSFYHEGTVLLRRRHALRFGRMFVYLKRGDISDLKELIDAFQWNEEFSSVFKDIDAKHVTQGPLSNAADIVTAATTAAVAAVAKKSSN